MTRRSRPGRPPSHVRAPTRKPTSQPSRAPGLRLLAAALAAAILGGCVSFSADGGFAPVEQAARDRLGMDLHWARSDADREAISGRVAQLLASPLSMDDAVQLALLNNRRLQAAFAELGIAEAELVQAGRLRNPGFSFGRFTRGDEVELERGLHFDLARLLAMPLVRQVETRRFEQAQAAAALQVLSLAAETRRAWVRAVAAEESVRYGAQVMKSAQASAELARRMAQAGNFNALQRAREQSFYADAALGFARAQQAQRAARERLTRLLGLWGAQASFSLPPRLPDLPASPKELPDIERTALESRLDVLGARLAVEQSARNLGLTRATRFVNVLELGYAQERSNEAPTRRGWEVGFELPIFDWSTARVARAEGVYMREFNRAAQTAIDARSEVREAYGAYRSAWDIARHHREEIVPLRQRIAEENLLRYNGMLIGVFELLADARVQIASVNAAIDALRDFWIAQADLDMAMVGRPGLAAPMAVAVPAAAASGAAPH
ncbi:TolC family protein [Quisquiliibacterium transsilvanicum]|uniref:Outer membrane protein TolC n=1 Tax=Quisquiliibacterium transsilvanicum TaxID=1549638 RepID=A0A7W8HFZ4_9BURK|nr:TolC family protein [Quisquiliibacterium transsilvanicum]MBB5271218.1 outer membrane protein TolC [Quisquiliibacterium transsilvanicum]